MARSPLYKTVRWFKIRAKQLKDHPLCKMCLDRGRVTKATVCDHVEPHRGDEEKFWKGPFQSLCQTCHSAHKQFLELKGKPRMEMGEDGWPIERPRGEG